MGPVTDSFEHGNERLGSIKGREYFFVHLIDHQLLEEMRPIE
jgi:hypothetical protein